MTIKYRLRRWAGRASLFALTLTLALATLCGAAQARYLEPDPLRLGGGSFSLFGYAKQNPLRYVDPSGLDPYRNFLGGMPDISQGPASMIPNITQNPLNVLQPYPSSNFLNGLPRFPIMSM